MFGVRLRQARTAKGWAQAELARAAGLTQAAVSQCENGVWVPSEEAVLNICRALGVERAALGDLTGVDEATPLPKPKRGRPKKG